MKTYSLLNLFEKVRDKSPYYQQLYKDIRSFSGNLEDLPIVDQKEYWRANSFQNNQVLTGEKEGILLRTGGTSGKPKVSIYSKEEWRSVCEILGDKLYECNLLKKYDIVANLLLGGDIYGGFLLISQVLNMMKIPILEQPIGGMASVDLNNAVSVISELETNVMISSPHLLMIISHYIKSRKTINTKVTHVLYGSDSLLEPQYYFLKEVFPNAQISSSGYASTDAGFLGYADSTCKMNQFRTDSSLTILEIIDKDTGKVIDDINKPGILVATNLTKLLMPNIRYPVGDLGMWVESKEAENRKLQLTGRTQNKENTIDLGDKNLSFENFYAIIHKSKYFHDIIGFQIELTENNQIVFKVATEKKESHIKKEVEKLLSSFLLEKVNASTSDFSIIIEMIGILDLKYNKSTGKALKIIKNK